MTQRHCLKNSKQCLTNISSLNWRHTVSDQFLAKQPSENPDIDITGYFSFSSIPEERWQKRVTLKTIEMVYSTVNNLWTWSKNYKMMKLSDKYFHGKVGEPLWVAHFRDSSTKRSEMLWLLSCRRWYFISFILWRLWKSQKLTNNTVYRKRFGVKLSSNFIMQKL